MKKTLSQLKKDAKSKEFQVKVIEFYGDKEAIPDKLQGWRNLSWQGNRLKFIRSDGAESYEQINHSNLIDYDDNILSLYNSLPNSPKEKGQKILVYEIRRRAKLAWIQA